MSTSLLRVSTPPAWLRQACDSRELLLIDHANCEKKAASTALSLMFAYAEDLELAAKLSRLAREELRHYEQVVKLLRSLKITPQRLAPGRYAERLRRLVAKHEPQRELDLMICGAFIEARSCERFAALKPVLEGPIGDLFGGLHEAEARHQSLYIELAHRAAKKQEVDVGARIEQFATLEAELIVSADTQFRFHSGSPARS